MTSKTSEVIQKQRNQSLNIQKQSFKGDLIKRCSELNSKITGEHLSKYTCQSMISMWIQRDTSKAWSWILDPDPDQPGPLKTWAQKNLDPGKHGSWKI